MTERYKKGIIILASIILLVLMVFSFGGRERVTIIEGYMGSVFLPIQRTLTNFGNFVDDKMEPIVNVLQYRTLNESLAHENAFLKEQIVALTMNQKELNELKDLKSALKYVDQSTNQGYVSSNVIAKDYGNWFNMFTIDVGFNQGVEKNSAVVNGSGLVGLVYEVGPNWSKVIAIIDQKSAVGFEMLRVSDDYNGILSGTTNYELVGELFDPQANVRVNDYIVTSGLGIYPKGILIGQIYEVIDDRDDFLKRIKVKPAVNFKKIDKVMVLPFVNNEKTVEVVEEDDLEEGE